MRNLTAPTEFDTIQSITRVQELERLIMQNDEDEIQPEICTNAPSDTNLKNHNKITQTDEPRYDFSRYSSQVSLSQCLLMSELMREFKEHKIELKPVHPVVKIDTIDEKEELTPIPRDMEETKIPIMQLKPRCLEHKINASNTIISKEFIKQILCIQFRHCWKNYDALMGRKVKIKEVSEESSS